MNDGDIDYQVCSILNSILKKSFQNIQSAAIILIKLKL